MAGSAIEGTAPSAGYAAILAVADDLIAGDGALCPPSTTARLWRAIDRLRRDGAPPCDVAIAEELSVMLARIQARMRDGGPGANDRQAFAITLRTAALSRTLLMALPMDFSQE